MSSTNIQIAVKTRPLIERELKEKVEPLWLIKENSIVQIDRAQNIIGEPYTFDHIFDHSTSNKEVYDAVVKPLVMSCVEGINCTIFAYGQTSSGKTHTMEGNKDVPGIIMYTIQDIFNHIEETPTKNFLLRCSYLEIYNEKINDLLDTNAKDLKIREDYHMVHVQAKEEVIREPYELFSIMKKGMKTRKIGCTDMNERSSRSHTIFKLVIQWQKKDSEGSYTESSLSLVDLAGSERVGQMNIKGERQAEGVSINKSLTTLGLVIRKLSENEQFINYRDSKLTRLLQHSLGGNSKTLIICAVTVAAAEETRSTLEFAQRAKYVKNRPIVNERVTDKDQLKQYAHLCQDYKDQIERLRLDKLEKDKTINALEDKISNINLFTSENIESTLKVSKIPQRRHTLGYYKPFMTNSLIPLPDSEHLHESEEDNQDSHDKSNVAFPVTSEDNKENVMCETHSPSKIFDIPQTPKAPKTPSPILRMQKGLLEESYDSLKSFTSHEKQLMEKHDQIKELNELIERLRNENIELKKQNSKDSQLNLKISEKNKDIFDNLILLRSILEEKPVEEIRRNSLDTIAEENLEMVMDQDDPTSCIEILDQLSDERRKNEEINEKCIMVVEENRLLKQQLTDKESIINSLKASSSKDIDEMEAKYTSLATENEQLKTQLETRNIKVNELTISIRQHNDIKEAELEILTKKIAQLNDYKEEMHRQLSEYQRSKEMFSKDKLDNDTALQKDLNILRKESDALKQSGEYQAFKIRELEEENHRLKTELQTKADLEKQVDDLTKNKPIEEAETEITDLRPANELKSKHIEEKYSKELSELKEELILKENKIAELEQCMANSSDKWDLYLHEFSDMKEKYNALEQDQVDMEKKIEKQTQLEIEYTTIISHIRHVLGEDLDIIDYVNTLEALKADNESLKGKLESNEQITEELRRRIERFKSEGIEDPGESENVNEENLLIIHDLQIKNSELTNEMTALIDAKANLQASIDQNICRHEQEIRTLTEKYTALHDQLNENLSALEAQQKQNDALNDQIKQYNEQGSQQEENNRLKTELEDVMFQLSGEQKEVENMCQQIDEKHLVISGLEKEICHLKQQISLSKSDAERMQELTKMNVTLQETLCQKEQEIETLKENCRFLEEECTKTANHLQENIQQLSKKNELENEIANLVRDNTEMKEELQEKKELNQSLLVEIKDLNEMYLGQNHQCDLLKDDNNRLNSDIEHVLSLLCEKENYISKISRQLDEHSSLISGFEQEILQLKERIIHLKLQTEQFQQISDINDCLRADVSNREEEIKNLQRQIVHLNEKDAETEKIMEEYIQQLKTQEDNLKQSKLKTTKLESANLELKNEKLSDNRLSELERKITNLAKENSELIENNLDLKERSTKQTEELKTLQEKCLTIEHDRKKTLEQLNNTLQELDKQTESYNDLETKCEMQGIQLENCKEELNNKIAELDEKCELYNNILTTYSNKNVKTESLESENEDLIRENGKLANKMELALKDLLNIKRNLDRRNEELSHLKGKYNALEVRLESKNRELEKQKEIARKTDKEALILEITELKSKVKYLSLALEQLQNENKLKTDQLKLVSEEAQILRQSIKDVDFLQAELERYKLNLQKINHDYDKDIILLKNTIAKLTDEKHMLEKELSKSGDRVTSFHQMKEELQACKELVTVLESQIKLKKSKVESLTQKLELGETVIDNLQRKVNDLVEYKKRVQEKITDGSLKEVASLPKLLDEERPLSPNELRRMKRQSIHDQRRGLSLESSDSVQLSDIDCPDCTDLRTKLKRILEKNKCLLGEIQDVKKNNESIKWENQYMTEKNTEMALKIKKLQERTPSTFEKIINCSDCVVHLSKLEKIEEHNAMLQTEMDKLKEENAFLDKENEDMLKMIREFEQSEYELHNQLLSCKNLPETPLGDDELRQLRTKYSEIVTQKTELEKQLSENIKLVSKYKNDILELESNNLLSDLKHENIEKELQRKLDDYQNKVYKTVSTMEDKGTQATCDLNEKYKIVKKLAVYRRQEANYLRAKLNLPPDCAVLPEDIKRQPTNV